jgi:hypothetical protein
MVSHEEAGVQEGCDSPTLLEVENAIKCLNNTHCLDLMACLQS